jgi:hypothetical protein
MTKVKVDVSGFGPDLERCQMAGRLRRRGAKGQKSRV